MQIVEYFKLHGTRLIKSLFLCLFFFSIGLCISIIGVSLFDFQIAVDATLEQITCVPSTRSGGYALGSLISGIIYKYMNTQLLIIICLTITCITHILLPLCRNLYVLLITVLLSGASCGAIDAASNAWVVYLWGDENAMYIQLIHFFYGLGSLLSPLIIRPFLLPLNPMHENHNFKVLNLNNNSLYNTEYIYSSSFANNTSFVSYHNNTKEDLIFQKGYFMTGGFLILLLIGFISLTIKSPREEESKSTKHQNVISKKNSFITKLFYVTMSISFFNILGLEVSFGTMLFTYAVKSSFHFEKSTASYLASLYWSTFTFFRILIILSVKFISNERLILLDLCLTLLANALLILIPNKFNWSLWLGTILMGFGTSSFFPTQLCYFNEILPLTPKLAALFLVMGCFGEFLIPLIMGMFLEEHPWIFLLMVAICTTLIGLSFLCNIYIKRILDKMNDENKK